MSKFDLENKDFNLENKDFNLENKGFNLENKDFNLENKGFNLENKGFNLENKGFNLENKDFNLENKEIERIKKEIEPIKKDFEPKNTSSSNQWIFILLMMLALIVGLYFTYQNGFFSKKIEGGEIENIIPTVKEIVEKPWKEPDLEIKDKMKYKQYCFEILNSNYDDKFKTNAKLLNTYLEKTDDKSKIDMLDKHFCSHDTKIEIITEMDMENKQIDDAHLAMIMKSSEKLQKLKDAIIEVKCPQKKQ